MGKGKRNREIRKIARAMGEQTGKQENVGRLARWMRKRQRAVRL